LSAGAGSDRIGPGHQTSRGYSPLPTVINAGQGTRKKQKQEEEISLSHSTTVVPIEQQHVGVVVIIVHSKTAEVE